MNDDEKSVTILDPSGNTYFMDGNGNITVTAPKNSIVPPENRTVNLIGKNLLNLQYVTEKKIQFAV